MQTTQRSKSLAIIFRSLARKAGAKDLQAELGLNRLEWAARMRGELPTHSNREMFIEDWKHAFHAILARRES